MKQEKEQGLCSSEVQSQREKFGTNKLPEPELQTTLDFVKDALFSDKIVILLMVMALIQLFLAITGFGTFSEPVMIAVVLGIITAIGVKTGKGVQEANRKLKEKSSLKYCNVIRDGKVQTINKDDIVVGDLVCIELGQDIYADGYIVDGEVSVSNAAINGETIEIHKKPIKGYIPEKITSDSYNNENCLFAGTTVMEGSGKMIVTTVGIDTVNGKTLVDSQTLEAPETALTIALNKLSDFITRWGSIAAFVAFALMVAIEVIGGGYQNQEWMMIFKDIVEKASVALTIIVAAVPEGLPMIVKLVTQQNVVNMEKANILAVNPNKIPEMAYLNLVCTDKTGTLTTGIMTPEIISGDAFQENLVLNNEAVFDKDGNITGGNSIDRAMLSILLLKDKMKVYDEAMKKEIVARQPFSSKLKFSGVSVKENDVVFSYYKGAPERILEHCTKYIDPVGGDIMDLDVIRRSEIQQQLSEANHKAIRCVAFARKNGQLEKDILPDDMVFEGFVGVRDPLREGVKEAVQTAKEAGIQVIEMTGDALETAIAIAREAGIYEDGDIALTDQEFSEMKDDKIKDILPRLKVIARCTPSTKLRLVTLAQETGMSVAMTGDGTNDSPALARADVGFAMNSGTDVAKAAGDIILTDDNFTSIIRGIKLGRTFMHNINMFLDFQLPINISLLLLNLVFPFFSTGAFLTSALILIINIIMDSLNSLSFGSEPEKEEYMKEKPFVKGTGLFDKQSKLRIGTATTSFILAYIILMFPCATMFHGEVEQLTACFVLLCFMAVMNGFCVRVEGANLLKGITKNKLFPAIAFGILAGAVIIAQLLYGLLGLAPLNGMQWLVIIILSMIVVPIDLARKRIASK